MRGGSDRVVQYAHTGGAQPIARADYTHATRARAESGGLPSAAELADVVDTALADWLPRGLMIAPLAAAQFAVGEVRLTAVSPAAEHRTAGHVRCWCHAPVSS